SREADHEEAGRDQQNVGERDSADHEVLSRRASTKAPTSAASSRTHSASNGSRQSEKISCAIGAMSPWAGLDAAPPVPATRERRSVKSITPKMRIAAPERNRWIA